MTADAYPLGCGTASNCSADPHVHSASEGGCEGSGGLGAALPVRTVGTGPGRGYVSVRSVSASRVKLRVSGQTRSGPGGGQSRVVQKRSHVTIHSHVSACLKRKKPHVKN